VWQQRAVGYRGHVLTKSRTSFAGGTSRRSSVLEAMNVMGDHWMLRLLGYFFAGVDSWSELSERMNVSPSTLSKRLKQLIDAGCVVRKSGEGRTTNYKLTPRGDALFPILAAADEWRLRWDNPDNCAASAWIHECGNHLKCRTACDQCDKEIYITDVTFQKGTDVGKPSALPAGRHFRNSANFEDGGNERTSRILQVLGDRRTSQLLAAFYLGFHRFDEFEAWTNMHPAIVSDRLRKMQHLGLVHMRLYQERPDRYLYSLSAAGRDIYGCTLQMLDWGDRWVFGKGKEPLALTHNLCGKRTHPILKCVHCEKPVNIGNTHIADPKADPFQV
jgi:DNA-binding HxlR family transcriptional regulator